MPRAKIALVVDDEALIRLDLAQTLNEAGFQTFEASSAQEAIRILDGHPEITVVFTDIQMPGTMDGVELARYVRNRWPPTIIVVSSGKVSLAQGTLPADIPFLGKPYDRPLLESVMSDVSERLTA